MIGQIQKVNILLETKIIKCLQKIFCYLRTDFLKTFDYFGFQQGIRFLDLADHQHYMSTIIGKKITIL
jgi:hypothetical protein